MKIKFNLPTKLLWCCMLLSLCNLGYTQIQYTQKFTKLLRQCEASFVAPIEGFYKIRMPRGSDQYQFDLLLDSEDKSFELRYKIDPRYKLDIPHVAAMTMASHLASNEERFSIEMNVFTAEQSESYFGADWAAYADFIPKPSFTNRRYGRLVSVFKSGKGLLQTIMFFDDHNEEKDRRLYSLTFEGTSVEADPN